MSDREKIPVERLREGDRVRAVTHGPEGRVVDADRCGWTIVEWHPGGSGRVLPYEHGKDRLMLLSPISHKLSKHFTERINMSEYAADQLRQILIAGPSEGEDFFRLQVSGNGSSNHVNITPDQLKLIARILDASILDEKEKELLCQMISDYFDALDRNGVEEEQPDLYKDLTDRCDDIERKLGLA